MENKRIGLQTINLPTRPAICASAAYAGKKEGEGPLGDCFDYVAKDELYGQDSFELAEKQLYLDAVACALKKAGVESRQVQF